MRPQREGIPADKGTGFASRAILKRAGQKDVAWHRIDPGKPQRNAFTESFNGSLCDELLSEEIFDTPEDAPPQACSCALPGPTR